MLRKFRKRLNLSQTELAELLDLNQNTVNKKYHLLIIIRIMKKYILLFLAREKLSLIMKKLS
ncbi:MAG: helix-turn-helix transcriptional regulator [Bacilli bacterium]|jgi:predicted transcriptional regulator|nr:helix-turn-helix transcriptional regulator [Bacilli bacterium]